MTKPDTAPEHCPGTESEEAGKASACAGCPNQNICATGPKGPDPGIQLVKERLESVKNKILILSGKGGVGKSTVTALLSRALAATDSERNVAVLDIDICGPSQPRVLGVQDEQVHQSGSGWSPVYVDDNLSLMSIGFLLASPDDAIIWRGPKKNGMIRQFLSEVDWGKLDYLLIDTPPGTSDEHLSAATYLSQANLTGAIIVTTPQEVALLDVRKEIDFCRKVKINILGVVENMSSFICPCCQKEAQIFPANTGGARKMCEELNVSFLGSLALDPKVARCCDEGKDFIAELPDSPVVKSLENIVKGRPLSPPPRHSPASEAAERHARIFAEDDLEDSRRRASKTIRENHLFDSRGGLFAGSRSASSLENGVDEETASRLQRIRASKRVALVDDVDLESTSSNLRTERMLNRSEKILDSVGINEYSARKAAMEDEFGYKNRALKVSYDDESDNMTKWTPVEEKEPSSAIAKIRQVRARIAASEDAAAEDSHLSSAALRARQSRARIDDIDEEMAAMSEKQAARERRVARLKALVAECESETVDDMGMASVSISEKKEKKTVRF